MVKQYLTLLAFLLVSACTSVQVTVHCAEAVSCVGGAEGVEGVRALRMPGNGE